MLATLLLADAVESSVRKGWVTIGGSHVFIGADGRIEAGGTFLDEKYTTGGPRGGVYLKPEHIPKDTGKPKPKESRPSGSTRLASGIPSNVNFRGSDKARADVTEAMKAIPEKAFQDSSLSSIVVSAKSIANPTLVEGDVVGHMDHGILKLYPGYDKSVIHHEFGHSLQNARQGGSGPRLLDKYSSYIGPKIPGGYGTRDSALKESFANSFKSYVNNGSHPFWNGVYGKLK